MALFGSRKIKELDEIIQSIKMNMENNYKDNAQDGYRRLGETYGRYAEEGRLTEKQRMYYEPILKDLSKQLEGFTHKE